MWKPLHLCLFEKTWLLPTGLRAICNSLAGTICRLAVRLAAAAISAMTVPDARCGDTGAWHSALCCGLHRATWLPYQLGVWSLRAFEKALVVEIQPRLKIYHFNSSISQNYNGFIWFWFSRSVSLLGHIGAGAPSQVSLLIHLVQVLQLKSHFSLFGGFSTQVLLLVHHRSIWCIWSDPSGQIASQTHKNVAWIPTRTIAYGKSYEWSDKSSGKYPALVRPRVAAAEHRLAFAPSTGQDYAENLPDYFKHCRWLKP
jgi:hypothetical protein